MPFHRKRVWQLSQFCRQRMQQFFSVLAHLRAAAVEKRSLLRFRQFDPQSLIRHRHVDMVLELLEVWNFLDRFLQLFFQLLHVVFADRKIFARAPHVAPDLLGCSCRVLEISTHRLLHLLARIKQPQHDKQRHHRCNKVRVRHLPRAAVVSTVATLLFDDDNWSIFLGL